MDELLELFDLAPWKDELTESYSHGMRQKLIISSALIHRPEVIVVDEPMVGLDPKSARLLKDLFREFTQRGGTILMSTHTLEVAEDMCDRIGDHPGRQDRRRAAPWPSCGTSSPPATRASRTLPAADRRRVRRSNWVMSSTAERARWRRSPIPGSATVLLPKWRTALARVRAGALGHARSSCCCWRWSRPASGRPCLRWPTGSCSTSGARRKSAASCPQKMLRRHPARVRVDPPPVQPGHRALDVLPREGPRHADRGADRLAAALPGQAAARRWRIRRGWWRCWRSRSSRPTASCTTAVPGSGSWRSARSCPSCCCPASSGRSITLVLVNVFPARRTRDLLSLVAIGAMAIVVVTLRVLQPERLARPEGFRNLVDFLGALQSPTSPFLPTEWTADIIMNWLNRVADPLPIVLLWSTARRVRGAGRAGAQAPLPERIHQGAGRRRAVCARQALAAVRVAAAARPAGGQARIHREGRAAVLPRYDAVEPADPARGAPAGLHLQHPRAAAVHRRARVGAAGDDGGVPEPGARRVRAGRHCGALRLSVGVARGQAALAALLEPARPRGADVEQVLDGHGAAAGPGAAHHRRHQRAAAGIAVHDGGEHRARSRSTRWRRARWRSASGPSFRSSTPRTPRRSRRASADWCT